MIKYNVRLFSGLLIFILSFSLAFADSPSLIKVKGLTKAQYLDMTRLGVDILDEKGGEFEIVAWPKDVKRLSDAGIPFDREIDDMTNYYLSRYAAPASMGGFRTFSEIVTCLDSLSSLYTSIMTPKFSIGTSIEGRDQWVVKISDNPTFDEEEPEVLYVSLIHSREPAAGAALLHFMMYLLDNYGSDPEITGLIDNRELYFLPVQNPDGYVYNEYNEPYGGGMWRKNLRDNGDGEWGVDLNRNYSYQWGYDNVGSSPYTYSETYRGSSAFSEPETANVRDFIISRNFIIIHNLHTYSNLEIWPYGYDRFYTYEEDFFANLGDSLTQYNGYSPGVSWTLYPTNGDADDWGWGDNVSKPRKISLTTEIGGPSDGFWPEEYRISTLCEENIWPNLFLAKIADEPYVIAPPKAPTAYDIDPAGSNFRLEWEHDDENNPAVSYRLFEYVDRSTVTDNGENDYGYWETARMMLANVRKHSGNFAWKSDTANRSNHWLVSTTPYEVKPDDSLKFWIWYAIEEDWDYFYAQVSTDGGFTYTNLANNMTTNYNPNYNNLGNGITGFSGDWVEAKFDLLAYEGQQVLFRLAYYTDNYYMEEGVYIDDIANVDIFDEIVEIDPSVTETYYDFEDKEDGEYWYRLYATDAQGQDGRYSNIAHVNVQAGSCCIGIRGNANADTSESINISDITFLVSYCFGGGPEPTCPDEGNANGDIEGAVNISDITYLVSYCFGGGPEPPACP